MSSHKETIRGKGVPFLFFLILISAALLFSCEVRAANTFATPDFAYPRTVAGNAEKVYRKSLKDNNGLLAMQAAMQLSVASGLISQDSLQPALQRFEVIAQTMNAPFPALSNLVQAQILLDYYNANRWNLNQRKVNTDSISDNPASWSGEIFEHEISKRINIAIENIDAVAQFSISDISPLLIDFEDAEKAGLTIADFVTIKSASLLTSLQMVGCGALLDAAIARHSLSPDSMAVMMLAMTRLQYVDSQHDRTTLAKNFTDIFYNTPYAVPFILACNNSDDVVDGNSARRAWYAMAKSYAGKFPDALGIASLNGELDRMTASNIEVCCPTQVIPGQKFDVEVKGANLYHFHLLAVKVDDVAMLQNGGIRYSTLMQKGEVVANIEVNEKGEVPDLYSSTEKMPDLPAGCYAIIPSSSSTLSGIYEKNTSKWASALIVSEISVITRDAGDGKGVNLFVVSGKNQRPLRGVKVTYYDKEKSPRVRATLLTDSSGMVYIPLNLGYYFINHAENLATGSFYSSVMAKEENKQMMGNLLTDKAIVHPGDDVECVAVVYTKENRVLHCSKGIPISILLRDANYEKVDSVSGVSDATGRFTASLKVPQSGLLGTYTIQLLSGSQWLIDETVVVSEYKAPTFYVELNKVGSDSVAVGNELKFSGKVFTYSGLPVSGAKFDYTISYSPPYWRFHAPSQTSYSGSGDVSNDGSLLISLPASELNQTEYAHGSYRLEVSVTSPAGETVSSTPLLFCLGDEWNINPLLPERINVSKHSDTKFSVNVLNMAGAESNKTLFYRVTNDDGCLVGDGSFESPNFFYDFDGLYSGKFTFIFSLSPTFDNDSIVKSEVIVYRDSDKVPPITTPLWIPEESVTVAQEARTVDIKVGSSYCDSWILASVSDADGNGFFRWVEVKDGLGTLTLDAPKANNRLFVELLGERNLNVKQGNVVIIPAQQLSKIKIETVSIRNRIAPGDEESWKFKISIDGTPVSQAAVMAVMTDKSLNKLAPLKWLFDPQSSIYWNSGIIRLGYKYPNQVYNSYSQVLKLRKTGPELPSFPQWNSYGYSLFPMGRLYGVHIRGAHPMMKSAAITPTAANLSSDMIVDEAAVEMAVYDRGPVAESKVMAGNGNEALIDTANIELRESEYPVAFFMPNLVADSSGLVNIDFTAPPFVGTWQLQVAAYSSDMKGSVAVYDVVASKKVMAKINAPMFVRTGDRLCLQATLYNNDSSPLDISGRIEFVDAATGAVIGSEDYSPLLVPASSSREVNASIDIPSAITGILIRAYASGGNHTDGEVVQVPVYPSATPVVESTPFWLGGAKGDFTLRLPDFADDARITLKYCDNPVWQAVTMLPALIDINSDNIVAASGAMFGNSIASGLFGKFPQLQKAINLISNSDGDENEFGKSRLSVDEGLKVVLVSDSPWVNDARCDNLRIASLEDYADKDKVNHAIASSVKSLVNLQNPDGGWSWCKGMKSSLWATSYALESMASVKSLGYLPSELLPSLYSGFEYMDKTLAENWRKTGCKYYSSNELLNYLYAKSFVDGVKDSGGFDSLRKVAIADFKKNWKNFSIADKAKAAILFNGTGEQKISGLILESLTQFSSSSPEKGIWFDNVRLDNSGYYSPVEITSLVLKAFCTIEPDSEMVPGLRQYLLICSQTQQWNSSRGACTAIDALLCSGPDWLSESDSLQIMIGKEYIPLPRTAALTGAFTFDIDPKVASGELLTVSRSASWPAWGGVISQYVAPIENVKNVWQGGLKIGKSLHVLSHDGKKEKDKTSSSKMIVGNAVRVNLVVTCDRDMEYIVVTDGRCAAIQPDVQVSQYVWIDGVNCYCEVGRENISFFIPRLSKGTHILSYDCHIEREGEYSVGVASVQSMLAPELAAHSAGSLLRIGSK